MSECSPGGCIANDDDTKEEGFLCSRAAAEHYFVKKRKYLKIQNLIVHAQC